MEGAEGLPPAARRALLIARLGDAARAVRIEAGLALAGTRDLPPDDAARLEKVLGEARAAAELVADQPDGLTSLGNLLRTTGKPAEAERAYREVLVRTPDYPLAAVNLADLLRELGRDAEGLAVLDAALGAAPTSGASTSAALHHARGLALVRLGGRTEAGAALERAWAPGACGCRASRSRSRPGTTPRGVASRARDVLLQTLARAPYAQDLLLMSANLADRAGDAAAVRGLLERLRALRPWDAELRAALEAR